MATIIQGLLSQNLPWGLVLVGVFVPITLELCGIHSLSFAVGSYLPISTTAPIFVGGVVRALVERATGKAAEIGDQRRHALQLRPDRRRLARRHPLRDPRTAEASSDDAEESLGMSAFLHEGDERPGRSACVVFLLLAAVLWRVGQRKHRVVDGAHSSGPMRRVAC